MDALPTRQNQKAMDDAFSMAFLAFGQLFIFPNNSFRVSFSSVWKFLLLKGPA